MEVAGKPMPMADLMAEFSHINIHMSWEKIGGLMVLVTNVEPQWKWLESHSFARLDGLCQPHHHAHELGENWWADGACDTSM